MSDLPSSVSRLSNKRRASGERVEQPLPNASTLLETSGRRERLSGGFFDTVHGRHSMDAKPNQDGSSSRLLPSIAHLTNPVDQMSDPSRTTSGGQHFRRRSNELPSLVASLDPVGNRTINSLSLPAVPPSLSRDSSSFQVANVPNAFGSSNASREGDSSGSSLTRNAFDENNKSQPDTQQTRLPGTIQSERARSRIELSADILNERGEAPQITAINAFRRDMERLEDWSSRIYYFATNAAPGTGNSAAAWSGDESKTLHMPTDQQFEAVIEQARNIASVLQLWRDNEYGNNSVAPLRHLREPSASRHELGDVPFRHQGGPSMIGLQPSHPSVQQQQQISWDQADDDAMRYRKRSVPKTPNVALPMQLPPPMMAGISSNININSARTAPPGRCHSCNISETPEWRRGPDGARTLCNACGLHFAKLTKKKMHTMDQGNSGSKLR